MSYGFSCKQENPGPLKAQVFMGEADRQADKDHAEREAHDVDGTAGVSN